MTQRPLPYVAFLLLALASPSARGTERAGSITGVVFDDRNGDGVRQPGEAGLPDVSVSNQLDVTSTGADGSYRLSGRGYGVVFVSAPRGHASVGAFWRAIPPGENPAIDFPLAPADDSDDFTFVHASDTHISDASVARTRALLKIAADRKADFVLVSGDLIKDALRVPEGDAARLYELYAKEMAASPVPVWSGPGNHENFGIERHLSLVSPKHPLYGKGMYRKYLGPNYYSFNRGKVHFIALDSVDIEDLWYYGHVDQTQLDWLEKDLSFVSREMTVVTFNHIPFFSAGLSVSGYYEGGVAPSLLRVGDKMVFRHVVSNAAEVLARLKDHRYALALAGHNHAYERLVLSPDPEATRFHLAAAVIGPSGAAVPSPAGVTLYQVRGGTIDDGEFIPLAPEGVRP